MRLYQLVVIPFFLLLFYDNLNAQDSIPSEQIEAEEHLFENGNTITLSQDEIRRLPFRDLNKFGLLSPSAYYHKNGRMFFYGIESSGGRYFIDGMQLDDADNFPVRSIASYQLYTLNTPIQFGNVLTGIRQLSTINPGRETAFDIAAYIDIAQGLNAYNTEFTLGIPLASKKRKMSNKPLASLFIGGKFNFTNNTDPVWKDCMVLKPGVLSGLQTDPLRPLNENGTIANAAFVTADDFTDCKYPAQASAEGWNVYSKLDIPFLKRGNIRLGNYSSFNTSDVSDFDNAIFNASNNQVRTTKNINSYININQLLKISDDISFNYDLQFQYGYNYSKTESKLHEDNFFAYGYLGVFETYKMPGFQLGSDSVNGEYYQNVWLLNSWGYDTLVKWSARNYNPEMAAYTNNYYEIYANNPEDHFENTDKILLYGGLINGRNPNAVYGLWNNTGMQPDNYQEHEDQKIRATAKFDLILKSHTIIAGGEYNRETRRNYSINPSGMWNLMHNLVNFHIRELDPDHPVAITHEGNVDTIIYYRHYDAASQRIFDVNLRKALGLPVDGVDYILTNSYDMTNNTISYYDKNGKRHTINTPENLLSLDMFSSQELLNGGFNYVGYAGYDYSGNRQSLRGDQYAFFSDFSMDAIQPVYGSAWVQDQFEWNNLRIRVGLRLDVYDANRPVLNDKYSLFPIYTVDEAIEKNQVDFEKPGNSENDWLVYIDNPGDPERVVGYRNDDTWYDALGNEVDSPELFGDGSGPYLKYMDMYSLADESWTPDMTFHDYQKAINLLPQVNIDYTIKNRSNLYVNYNSSTQNPNFINDFRPDMYYYFHSVSSQQKVIPNPALKPMRAGKLMAGIKTKIYNNLVTDIAFLMNTVDNYYQVSFIEDAYPHDYFTIVNSANRVSDEGITASFNYTNTVSSGFYGGLNLTKLFPDESDLNYLEVSPLVINAHAGYRFGNQDFYNGPVWGNNKFLHGFSAMVYYQFRKGTPYYYTKNKIVKGTKNLPSFNLLNLNVSKDIQIGPEAVLNLYLKVENLLNAKNAFEVYSETGLPDDDGFLSDPLNANYIEHQKNPESFRLLYQMHLNNPAHFDIPRIWRIGLIFSY